MDGGGGAGGGGGGGGGCEPAGNDAGEEETHEVFGARLKKFNVAAGPNARIPFRPTTSVLTISPFRAFPQDTNLGMGRPGNGIAKNHFCYSFHTPRPHCHNRF